jgi:hypothetical protein
MDAMMPGIAREMADEAATMRAQPVSPQIDQFRPVAPLKRHRNYEEIVIVDSHDDGLGVQSAVQLQL